MITQNITDVGGHIVGTVETENGFSDEKLATMGKGMLCPICYDNYLKNLPRDFNVDLMVSRLGEILPILSNFDLRFELSALEAYAKARNFSKENGMSWYLSILVLKGIATQDDFNKIAAIMLEQNIVL